MKATSITIAAFSIIAFLFACNQKKAQEQKTEETNETVSGNTTEKDSDPATKPYQVVGYRKTACFGKCPVFEVKFFSDNKATWSGKMHVERMGDYVAKLGESTIKDIKNKANEVGYLEFYNQYPIEHKVADLPTTITYLRIGDMEKSVKNTHEGPEKLAEYEAYLEGIINGLDWKPAAKD